MSLLVRIGGALVAGLVLGLTVPTAHATSGLADRTPLPDGELAEQRGGFDWAGMDVSFGADMKTYLNGDLVLQTIISIDPAGIVSRTMASNALTPASAMTSLPTGPGKLDLPQAVAGSPVYFANGGQTALIQASANGTLQNILVNSAPNLTAVQRVDAALTLSNYASFLSTLHSNILNNTLGYAVASFSH